MNFKEIYKSANNEIHGNRKLIDSVFAKAEKKHTFKAVYPAACAAALAVIAAVVLYPADSGKNISGTKVALSQNEKSNIESVKDERLNVPENSINTDNTSDVVESESQSLSKVKNTDTNSVYAETDISKETKKNEQVEKNKTSDSVQTFGKEDKNESLDIAESVGIMVASLDAGKNDITAGASPKMRASGGACVTAESYCVQNTQNLSADEYYNYLGVNVKEKSKIPEGMVFNDFSGTQIEYDSQTGEIISDSAVFSVSDTENPDRYISISVTKLKNADNTKHLDGSSSANNSDNEKNTNADTSDEIRRAYIQSGDIYYSVTSCNVNEKEIQKLLFSLSE